MTLFAANTPHIATENALLAPLITFVLLLPHLGQRIVVSMGAPQLGQDLAILDTSLPHSGHLIIAILLFIPFFGIGLYNDYMTICHISQSTK